MDMECYNRILALEFKRFQTNPLEGFYVRLVNDNLRLWEVAIFGPPETVYKGGYFKIHMAFPSGYPSYPPTIRFINPFWHPNVYGNGTMCISILPPPDPDFVGADLSHGSSYCVSPTYNVRAILLAVTWLLNEPNVDNAANGIAARMYECWKKTNGANKDYKEIVEKIVKLSRLDAKKDGVAVPMTVQDYCLIKYTVGSDGKAHAVRTVEPHETDTTEDNKNYLLVDNVEEQEKEKTLKEKIVRFCRRIWQ